MFVHDIITARVTSIVGVIGKIKHGRRRRSEGACGRVLVRQARGSAPVTFPDYGHCFAEAFAAEYSANTAL